jgi:RHS repeat-associated protein
VTVNYQPTYRKGEYFRAELNSDNSVNPVYLSVTNIAVLTNGAGPNITSTNTGSLYLAKAAETFFHDLDGNLTSDSLWTNTWNGENRLIATESSAGVPPAGRARETWTHLPDGRWIERVISTWNTNTLNYQPSTTNKFVWDGQVLLAILNHTNGLVASFARGLDLSGSIQGAGGVGGVLAVSFGLSTNSYQQTTHFAGFDGNGNLSALVSSTNGVVTAQYDYSPFGETLRANGVVAKANPIRFSTQFADDMTGRRKYFHRDLTDAGRWPNRDPINEAGGLNLYAFVGNRVPNRIDPLGLADGDGDCPGLPKGESNAQCYQYACGNYGKWSDTPGGRGGQRCKPPYTCDGIKKGAIADGMTEVPADGKCPEGTHKVSYSVGTHGNGSDYHWMRQKADGTWCHKFRLGGPSNLDGSGKPITDPEKANQDFPANGKQPPSSYKHCGYLCAPDTWK